MKLTGYCLGSVLVLISTTALGAPLDAGTDGATRGTVDSGVDSGSPSLCGNDVIDQGETCDGTRLNAKTCATATMGTLSTGVLKCTPSCRLDTSGCHGPTGSGGTSGAAGGAQGNGGAPIGSAAGATGTAGRGGAGGTGASGGPPAGIGMPDNTTSPEAGVAPGKSTTTGGCGCRVAERSTSAPGAALGALVAVGLWLGRRRPAS